MDLEYQIESIRTPALRLDYYLVPWDTQILGVPVAQISDLQIIDPAQAARDYQAFSSWCDRQHVALCACRLAASRLADSMFLQEHGFRFVELNYLPRLQGLQALRFPTSEIAIAPANLADRDTLCDMAGQVFRHGRFHQDPRIDPALGDRRYRGWMENAFANPHQSVLKCLRGTDIVGFFVTESPEAGHCFWSLIGLAPGLSGKGLGKAVWRAMLDQHRLDGIDTVSTSISSHNVSVFNLYVSLGFRFPEPSITLHWRPDGSGVLH